MADADAVHSEQPLISMSNTPVEKEGVLKSVNLPSQLLLAISKPPLGGLTAQQQRPSNQLGEIFIIIYYDYGYLMKTCVTASHASVLSADAISRKRKTGKERKKRKHTH